MTLALPTVFTLIAAAFFLTLERLAPWRELPNAPGWYGNIPRYRLERGPVAAQLRRAP